MAFRIGRLRRDQRGLGLIEIAVVLVIVAIVGALLYRYVTSTAKTVEKFKEDRPLAHTRLAADQATLAAMQGALQTYRATNEGKLPPDKAAVAALMAGPPKFQCEGGDFDYDPVTGALRLTITDASRC
jgi:prepilin-type N-terminal cleavage/methylation domain-containing protein